ncbi:hypothetical protein BKA61DRAFT_633561 [Leptodontidium sp. MPI-SDFR-AT-0119]|nr:hypothetical protein BKA61DRAFT_633561 [Leptodontidium sp. MPI-SDFR-AT-0119]
MIASTLFAGRVTPKEQKIAWHDFAEKLWVKKDVAAAFNDHALKTYIQHNPATVSGRDASIRLLGSVIGQWTISIQHQAMEGDYSFIHWKVEGLDVPGFFPAARYHAVVDVFRWEGGCIAEHWDSIQAAPPVDRPNPLELI